MKIAVRVGKIAVRVGKVAAACALAMPALAQYSGVSHPDRTPILNNPEPAYQAPPAPALTPRTETAPAPVDTASARMPEPMMPAANPDPDAGIVTRIPGPANQLPIGTLVKVALAQDISTETTAKGSTFTAQLLEPMMRDGVVLIPAGSTLSGVVTDAHGGKRFAGPAQMHLRTTNITLPDGTVYKLHGQVIDTSLTKDVKVDREGTLLRKDHAGKVAEGMALTTGSGLAAGAVIAGLPGALVGAGVGAGVSTVVLLKQERQMELPENAKVTFWLTEPLTVGGR